MGRKALYRTVSVWMNGERIGLWSVSASGEHSFKYDADWILSDAVRPLSLSMPVRPENAPYKGSIVESYFDNLLPDSLAIRKRIQARFQVSTIRPFDLLTEIGRDCIGAVQILQEDSEPEGLKKIEGIILSDVDVENILRNTTVSEGFLGRDESLRISIAGAQEKNALLWDGGCWKKPLGPTPTTHILKLPLGIIGGGEIDLRNSVENEWLTLKLLKAWGLSVPHTEIIEFGKQKILSVERFDRRRSQDDSWIIRLPQEDFCQVTGTSSGLKYESDGGPGIVKIMEVLSGSQNPQVDRRNFMKAQILFWILGAVDGHAKNFSIFVEQGGRYRLTPFYDVLSIYPVIGRGAGKYPLEKIRMAMSVVGKNRHYKWNRIYRRHWLATAGNCGFPEKITNDIISEILFEAPGVISAVQKIVPSGFPGEITDSIFMGIQNAIKRLE